MRWPILTALLDKEARRHLANRGGIALVILLLAAAMLLSFFGGGNAEGGGLMPGVRLCFLDYAEETPLVRHLRDNVPDDLYRHLRFRPLAQAPTDSAGRIQYPINVGAIQLRPANRPGSAGKVWVWYPGGNALAMAPYEIWFWKETLRFVQQGAGADAPSAALFDSERSSLSGGFDPRSGLAAALVLFGLFFVCIYLLPSLTCEEHERGLLLAQALSPASTGELLAARYLFYPVVGIALAAALAGTYQPVALLRPFFWLTLVATVVGAMGIGLTIASLARTQRAASMGAMSYMLAVALLLFICQQNGIPWLPYLALEYHAPRLIHAALTDTVHGYHWVSLGATGLLSLGWTVLATALFRQRGWQ